MIQTSIETKRVQLAELERVEAEATRLSNALSNGSRSRKPAGISNSSSPTGTRINGESSEVSNTTDDKGSVTEDSQFGTTSLDPEQGRHSPEQDDTDLPSYNVPIPKRRTPGMGLFNALSYTIHGMMDVDPETARRNNITKTRESIAQVLQPFS